MPVLAHRKILGATRQAGGSVTIESAPGRGTTARVFPPVAAGAAHGCGPGMGSAIGTAAMQGVNVLYVEDEPLVGMATTDALESAGFQVHAAPSAEAALKLLRERPEIELIVTDVGLPGMNGYDLVNEARRLKPDVKAVFVTGYDRAGTIGKLTADAATDFIDKPYDPEDLVRSIRRLLQRQA
ncbi:MAG: response regulator [Alphaproteobacteria bacterium]|nr:response regulator [Alphaproteobacteria bacterium]